MFGFWSAPRLKSIVRKGCVALDDRDHDLASCWFAEAIRINRSFAPGHLGLGLARMRKGDFTDAIRPLSEAIRLSDDPRAYYLRGLCHIAAGNSDRGESDRTAALVRNPLVEESLR